MKEGDDEEGVAQKAKCTEHNPVKLVTTREVANLPQFDFNQVRLSLNISLKIDRSFITTRKHAN